MPNLYSVRFMHYSPKDSEEGIIGYVVANNEEQVYNFVKEDQDLNGLRIRPYSECDEDTVLDIYNDDWEVIGKETYKERMLRVGGQMNDEDAEVEDAYYGVTHYGWKLESVLNEEEVEILKKHIKAVDLRKQQ